MSAAQPGKDRDRIKQKHKDKDKYKDKSHGSCIEKKERWIRPEPAQPGKDSDNTTMAKTKT